MRRSRNKVYDGALFAATLGLMFLYIADPYNKLSMPPFEGPQTQGLTDDYVQPVNPLKPPVKSEEAKTTHLRDYRSPECRKETYAFGTGKASLIITVPSLNYITATLNSLLESTTWKFVEEVIAIDHGDLPPKDMAQLRDMMKKDIRGGKTLQNTGQGHVSARIQASKEAQGDVMIFLEAGAIVSPGWLEPLLDTLNRYPKSFVMPSYDQVSNSSTFTYIPNERQFVPFIDRDMAIKMKVIEETDGDEIEVATIRRECFAAKSEFFRHVGMLDQEVGDVGGVHQELSLRLWQCGGSIRMCTCSRVGLLNFFHFLIVHNPHNIWRISEMWRIDADDWDPFYTTNNRPKHIKDTARKSVREKMDVIRQRLTCDASPKRFIDQFLPKLTLFDLKPSEKDLAFQKGMKSMVGKAGGRAGLIRSKSARRCLSPDDDRVLKLGPCDPAEAGVPREKMTFRFTHLSQLKVDGRCVTAVKNNYLRVMDCDNANEVWNYREQQSFVWEDTGQLLFWFTKQCIMHVKDPDPATDGRPIVMKRDCSRNKNLDFSTFEILY